MKKKRGFTLIEIIGAIVILGIVAIIAFATYTSSLRGFRENYYTGEIKSLEKSGIEFFDDNRNYKPQKILNAQEVLINTLETKKYLKKVVDYNGDPCDKSSYVMVVNEGNGDFSYHACLICDKDGYDNTNEDVYCDKSWLDPTKVEYGIGTVDKIFVYKGISRDALKEQLELPISYMRKDNNGKVIAERRGTREGSEILSPVDLDAVDTNTIGNYKVTYKYGMEEKTREVRVYEHKAPNIVYEKENIVAKNLSGETKKEKKTYTPGEWAQSIIVTLSSKAFEDTNITGKGYQWNIDGRWQDFCNSDPCTKTITREMNQSVQFRLIDTNDNVSVTTDLVSFKIDRTSPICELKVPTTKGDNDWYKTNVDIQFNEKTDPKAGNDEAVVSGIKQYNIQVSTENLTRVATVNAKTHTQDTGGIKYIGYVEDEAENFSTCEVTLKKDATLPNCSSGGDSTTWTKNDRTITYGCDDSLSGCATGFSGGSKPFSTTTKTATIAAYTIKDNAGNQTTCAARDANVYVDKTAPGCTSSGDSTTWTNSNRTIYYGCKDDDSGCASGNSGGNKPFSTTTKTATIAAYTIKDNAGNQTTCAARDANVYVDKTAPGCTSSGDSTTWTNSNRTIYYGCKDDDSGCNSSYSGGNKPFSTTTKTSSIAAYTIKDNAGNSKDCPARNANVYVDKTAPTCTNSGDSTTWTSSNRTIYFGCKDDDSGCNSSFSGGSRLFNTSTQTATIAAYTIKDNAGNSKDCPSRTANVYVTKAPPTCSVTKSNTYSEAGVTTTVTCSSDLGCDTSKNPTGDTGLKAGKTYTVYDKTGQTGTCSVTVSSQLQARTKTCKYGFTCTRPSCGTSTTTYNGSNPTCGSGCTKKITGSIDINGIMYYWTCTCTRTCSSPSACGCGEWNEPGDWYNVSSCNTDGCVNGTYDGNTKWDDYRTVYY